LRTHRQIVLLAAILVLGLAARLAYVALFAGLDSPPEYDGVDYDLLARNLLAGEGYDLYFGPTAFRAPGYPLFLAGAYAVTGGSWAAVRILQALLGTATIAAAYALARQAFGRERVALLAAALVAVHPVLLYLTGIVYPEVLASLLVTVAAALLARLVDERRVTNGQSLLLGLLLGAGVLLRPAVLLFAALVAAVAAWVDWRQRGLPARAALIPAVVLLCLLPWTVRNYRVFGELIPLTTEAGVTFWGGNHPQGNGGHVQPAAATWQGGDPPQSLYGWAGLSETEGERLFYGAALEWIRHEPLHWLKLLPQKLARSWMLVFGNEARANALPGWIGKVYLLFPLSVLAGLVLSWIYRRKLVAVYCLLAAQTLTTLAFYGSTRQSALVIPCALVLSAFALDWLYEGSLGPWRHRRRASLPEPDADDPPHIACHDRAQGYLRFAKSCWAVVYLPHVGQDGPRTQPASGSGSRRLHRAEIPKR
jgi:4-amino-4-deoxy-L-arabinose transferase-like glycosyltransferase